MNDGVLWIRSTSAHLNVRIIQKVVTGVSEIDDSVEETYFFGLFFEFFQKCVKNGSADTIRGLLYSVKSLIISA